MTIKILSSPNCSDRIASFFKETMLFYHKSSAVDNDGTFDKESTSCNDIFDAFRLALKFYHFEQSIVELIVPDSDTNPY